MSKTKLKVFGFFEIPFNKVGGTKKHISKENIREFWKTIKNRKLENKQGCYVFAMKSKGCMPYYIGMTKNTNGFEKEAFEDNKVNKYNSFLVNGKRGTPVMYFVAPDGNKKVVDSNDLKQIEKFLIQNGKLRNPDILNKHHAKIPDWEIDGVVRSGKGHPGKIALEFKTMMGI